MTLTRRAFMGGLMAAPLLAELAAKAHSATIARRIVTLDLLPTELLLTLGFSPIAVANLPLYRKLVAVPSLPLEVVDIGPLLEPNLEYLQHLKPDLIMLADWQILGQDNLARIAPLAPISTVSRDRPAVEHLQDLLLQVGAMVGKGDEARMWNARADDVLAAARRSLAARKQRPVYVIRLVEDGRHAAIFGGNGMIGDVLRRLGLDNAFDGKVNASGVATIGIERLAAVPEAQIVHFHRGEETERALQRLRLSPFWNALQPVRENRVIAMPVIYPNGGIHSAIRLASQLDAALAPDANPHG
ncbi:ABC transporter substrate-binding protein [Phyllobacterium sp. 21LDTY02-6]|uniref:ABC transporter substrate-binding protein n=1 Tax=Phyllobacterium sp. 21LDTY02-6 TaxID=2944903 RepID=UPI0020202EC9|nr:ABC transporter substrate-binding protein [Phyllobacterium sp. 21LDTY02-6]